MEYEWKVWQFRLQLARQREPFRDVQTQMANLMRGEGDEPVHPHQLFPLQTDRFNDALRQPKTQIEDLDTATERMKAKGLF